MLPGEDFTVLVLFGHVLEEEDDGGGEDPGFFGVLFADVFGLVVELFESQLVEDVFVGYIAVQAVGEIETAADHFLDLYFLFCCREDHLGSALELVLF